MLVPEVANPLTARMVKGVNTTMDEGQTMVGEAFAFQPRIARNDRGGPSEVAYPLTAEAGRTGKGDSAQAIAFHHQMGAKAQGIGDSTETSITLGAKVGGGAVAFDHLAGGNTGFAIGEEVSGSLRVSGNATGHQSVALGWRVRRLTPTECERLQAYPDGYTQIPRGNKPTADGPRYKALGNSWSINAAEIIGERMQMVDAL